MDLKMKGKFLCRDSTSNNTNIKRDILNIIMILCQKTKETRVNL